MLFKFIKTKAFLIPLLIVLVIWGVFFLQSVVDIDWHWFMLKPRSTQGLIGVLTSELLHGSVEHIASNTLPLFFLSMALLYYYPELATKVLAYVILIGNFWTWIYARGNFHLGASGVIYGLASFLFFSGYIRREKKVMAISLLVVMVYGSMVWGVLPEWIAKDWLNFDTTDYQRISWEGHLNGAIAGLVLAIYFRKIGIQKPKFEWKDDDLDNLPPEERYWEEGYQPKREDESIDSTHKSTEIIYIYKKNPPSND